MKYIKLYEQLRELKYKAGDYVLVPKWNYPYNFCYIKSTDHSDIPYLCTLYNYDNGIWIKEEEIERLLTPEEIEISKNLKETDKYNL